MKQSRRVPCPAWATKLAATHAADLSLAEHAALAAHIANCPACASILQSYRDIEASLLALPPIEPRALHPEQLPARRRAEERHLAPFEKKRRDLKLVAPPAAIRHQSVPHPVSLPVSRRARFMKAISTLVAVLVTGALLSGFLVLFTSRHPSSVGSSAPVQPNLAVYAELSGKKSAFYALRPQDGSILWQYHLPDGHTWASGSVVSHGVVYVCADGSVSALRASDGALLWSHRVGTPGSPFIVDGVLYVGILQGAVYALRTSDGSQLWRHSTPTLDATIVAVADGLIYTRADGLYVLRTSDGSVAWHDPAFQNTIRPMVVSNGKVYVSVSEERTMAVLRSSDGKPLRSLPLSGDLLAANGFVYVLGQEELSAVRVSDDKVLWHFQPGSGCPTNSEFSSIYDGTIYEIDSLQTSDVCAFRASDGMLLWHWHQPISDAFSIPVEADGRVYFSLGEKLYALRARDGSLLWYSSWGATGAPSPVVG